MICHAASNDPMRLRVIQLLLLIHQLLDYFPQDRPILLPIVFLRRAVEVSDKTGIEFKILFTLIFCEWENEFIRADMVKIGKVEQSVLSDAKIVCS